MSKTRLLNIVIYYDNEDEVVAYATELSKQSKVELITLIIVVNKSYVNSFDEFRFHLSKLGIKHKIYFPGMNLGYLNGAIFGYKSYIEESIDIPDWVLISNTDVSFNSIDFFKKFMNNDYEQNIWVVGPSVYSSMTRSYSNPQYLEKTSIKIIDRNILIFSHPFLAYFFIKASGLKARLHKRKKIPSCYTFTVHGCFFFINRHLADYFIEKPFKVHLYSEEGYVANVAYEMGKKSYYDSSLEIIHYENAVTKLIGFTKKSKYVAESLKAIKEEFYR